MIILSYLSLFNILFTCQLTKLTLRSSFLLQVVQLKTIHTLVSLETTLTIQPKLSQISISTQDTLIFPLETVHNTSTMKHMPTIQLQVTLLTQTDTAFLHLYSLKLFLPKPFINLLKTNYRVICILS